MRTDMLALLIRKQNTGHYPRTSDKIVCEMFEVSIPNKECLHVQENFVVLSPT